MIVAIDFGSTHLKAIALGDRVAAAAAPAPPEPAAVLEVAAGLASSVTGASTQNARGLALSGAMHTLLPVDAHGDALGPVTTWADGAPIDPAVLDVTALADLAGPTGCPPWPVYHPARLAALRGADPVAFARAARFVGLRDWAFHRLTGRWWTDDVTASTTGLLDVRRGTWSEPVLEAAGISAAQLPRIVRPSASSPLRDAWAGLPKGLPVVVGSVDGALVHTALDATRPGDTTISVGTTAALRTVSPTPRLQPGGRAWCYRMIGGPWLIGSAANNGGLLLDRVRSFAHPGLDPESGFDRLFADAAAAGAAGPAVDLSRFLIRERDGVLPRSRGAPPQLAGHAAVAAGAVAYLGSAVARLTSTVESVVGSIGDPWLTGLAAHRPELGRAITNALGIPTRAPSLPDPATIGAAILGFDALGLEPPPIDRAARWIAPSNSDRPEPRR